MDRKRAVLLTLGGALAAAGVLGTVAAQAPPPLPSTFYGQVTVPDVEVGDSVLAIVEAPGGSGVCGWAEITNDPTFGLVYVVDVKASEPVDSPLCGTNGRTVRFYFPKQHVFAAETGLWSTGVRPERDLSAGEEIENLNFAPNSAYSGRN